LVELELLQLVEGGGLKPAAQIRGEERVVVAVIRDREAAGGAWVRGEDAGDLPAFRDAMDVALEVERSGAP